MEVKAFLRIAYSNQKGIKLFPQLGSKTGLVQFLNVESNPNM
jgi:hypothetical protein